jgi:hypothetical protein
MQNKELDRQVRPHAIGNCIHSAFINSMLEVTKPDSKNDDCILTCEEDEIEPITPLIDNFA